MAVPKVIICVGPGDSKYETAEKTKRSISGADVLVCSDAKDIQQKLRRYENYGGLL
jgi:hypothetical protein